MKIIPSILTNDLHKLTDLEKKSESIVDRIQIDVIDNKFANNSTVDPSVLKDLEIKLNLDFHLMVKDPIEWIDHCLSKPENRIIGQIEFMQNQSEFVDKVKASGSLAGLAIDLPTPIENIDQGVLDKVDVVLLMSVQAGFGGQEFSLDTFPKIEKLAKIRSELNLNFKICVDGGINKQLIKDLENLGVDEVAIGQRIFEPDLKQNLEALSG